MIEVSPKVTIGIPTLNRAEYLRGALFSALSQSYKNIEVVVSNNASTDHTETVLLELQDPRLVVLRQPATISMTENWNSCLVAASGDYFLLLSDDDLLEPVAIEEMVRAFENTGRNDEIGFVYSGGFVIDQNGNTLSIGPSAPLREDAGKLIVNFFDGKRSPWPCATLFRKKDIAEGYDSRFPRATDAAQWIQVVARYPSAAFVDRKLARYRVHQNTTSLTPVEEWRSENQSLGEFAIRQLARNGKETESYTRAIRLAVHRLNVRITSELINNSLRHRKRSALARYWQNRSIFFSFYGFWIFVKGIALLSLPNWLRAGIRRMLYPRTRFLSVGQ